MQDTSGAVIPGAQVAVTNQDGKAITQGLTDNAGNFSFNGLPTGSYTVDVTKDGFREIKQQTKTSSEVHPQIRIVLPVATVTQELIVGPSDNAAQVSTEIPQNQTSNAIDRDALDRLPVFDQDYITTMSRFLDPDATGTNGVTLVVNGVEANGPGVTASAIQSVRINQNPYTALYSRPGRARIEITTKGGTPQFHGSGNFLYRDSVFDASNAFATTKPSEQRTYYEGSLTGPLSHSKKTTFLLALDKDNDNQQAIVVAAGPNGEINANVPNPTNHYFISGRVFHDYKQGNQFWIG
ncbi:carboxypeptidase-like regulatory domain-containing protein, partial [Alloacidobacterium sp.]|uniref:carboxypeptidase-like regulatory domain-containing protein n=1 Tax=Alloacidobacterium sp. TaxID=2951999 RepID=UPI002D528033